jgi:hypothetical protein
MGRRCLYLLLVALAVWCMPASAQQYVQPDSLGLPGDNLNLYAVLKVFQESPTLEEFEKRINAEDANINNLDLDGDGMIDYIRVVDHVVNDIHTIVLQVPITRTDFQDVAVIDVRRIADNRVYIQVIGDEALYGKDYIIEPNYDPTQDQTAGATPNPGYTGPKPETRVIFDGRPINVVRTTPYEVGRWPIIRYVFLPEYRPWFSPWYFAHYPAWWRPWRPMYWHYYMGYQYHYYDYYYGNYRRWQHYRDPQSLNRYYGSIRSYSPVVVERMRKSAFRDMYSRPDLRRDGMKKYDEMQQNKQKGPAGEKPRINEPPTGKPGGQTPHGTPPTGTKPSQPGGTKPSSGTPQGGKQQPRDQGRTQGPDKAKSSTRQGGGQQQTGPAQRPDSRGPSSTVPQGGKKQETRPAQSREQGKTQDANRPAERRSERR